jgi:hypothetical protein
MAKVTKMKQQGELVKISLNFPPDLWTKLKHAAVDENTTATEILVRLARQYLAKPKAKKKGTR